MLIFWVVLLFFTLLWELSLLVRLLSCPSDQGLAPTNVIVLELPCLVTWMGGKTLQLLFTLDVVSCSHVIVGASLCLRYEYLVDFVYHPYWICIMLDIWRGNVVKEKGKPALIMLFVYTNILFIYDLFAWAVCLWQQQAFELSSYTFSVLWSAICKLIGCLFQVK